MPPLARGAGARDYAFETLSNTKWAGSQGGERISAGALRRYRPHLDAKLAAFVCYESEMRPFPHPRSPEAVRALAQLRGSAAGLAAAEVFSVLFERP